MAEITTIQKGLPDWHIPLNANFEALRDGLNELTPEKIGALPSENAKAMTFSVTVLTDMAPGTGQTFSSPNFEKSFPNTSYAISLTSANYSGITFLRHTKRVNGFDFTINNLRSSAISAGQTILVDAIMMMHTN